MSAKRVFLTRLLPGDALDGLGKVCSIVNDPGHRSMGRDELLGSIKEVDGIISTLADTIGGEVMELAGPDLTVISNFAVGYNNIDLPEATKRGILVCNTPDVLTDATADMAFAMLLSLARDIRRAHDFTGRGMFTGWDPELFLGVPVWGKTIGILGLGKIGTAVATRARGFNMEILYHNRKRVDPSVEERLGARMVPLEDLLKKSDFLVILVPLTGETKGMIGAGEISMMKGDACLINISRGEVIREGELASCLEKGIIRGAALDVYEREPEIHPALSGLENVLLLPHIGSATGEARTNMARLCVENLLAALRGEKPPAAVNYHQIKSKP